MEDKSKFEYDVCIINLNKSTSSETLKNFFTVQDPNSYLCLGHFDMIQVQRVPTATLPLGEIQNIAQNYINPPTGNCQYPLYALKQIESDADQSKEELNDFWNMICNFFFIIRFHCDRVEEISSPFTEALLKRSRYQPTESAISHLQINSEINSYTQYLEQIDVSACPHSSGQLDVSAVLFYDALELGDIVGIIKSNSMSTAMSILQHLCGCKVVSDAYTYCGINRELLRHDTLPPIRNAALCTHNLTCTTTRFSIKLASEANNLLQELQKSGSCIGFVTGTADVLVEWPNFTESDFISYIRTIAHFDKLYEAFSDIITRIGIRYIPPLDSRPKNPPKKPFAQVLDHNNTPSNIFTGWLERWHYPVSRMVNTLQAMYNSSSLDALALLLLPGVNAFLSRVRYIKTHNLRDPFYEQDITDFLDSWFSLANDITHLESQIMQHPELTPTRYYIPAMVLQFERSFLMEYVNIITKLDTKADTSHCLLHPREFAPILLPTSEESVYTKCPLDPEFDTQYTEASPLCIYLPVQHIYQPWLLTHMLCHEIQHYSGDALRCRNERLTHLARSAAAYIVAFFILQALSPGCYQPTNLPKERDFQEEIASLIAQQLTDTKVPPYLKHIENTLSSIMLAIAQRPDNQERMQNILYQGREAADQMAQIRWMCELNTLTNGVVLTHIFSSHAHYLCGLYKECYADISMILTLDCSFQDYYDCFYEKNVHNIPKEPYSITEIQVLERHTDRLAFVMLTIEKSKTDWISEKLPDNKFIKIARDKVEHWRQVYQEIDSSNYSWKRLSNDTILPYALLADEAAELESYLSKCAAKLNDSLKHEEKSLTELRSHLKYVNCQSFNWNQVREYINKSI